jgi:hypothetical protein
MPRGEFVGEREQAAFLDTSEDWMVCFEELTAHRLEDFTDRSGLNVVNKVIENLTK